MADDYIDYLEVGEYGRGCVAALARLAGAATLVNIAALSAQVEGAVSAVDLELEKAGIQRGDLRGQRRSVGDAAADGRKEIEKFHAWLKSQDDHAPVDREAFFPGMRLGPLAALKPADVQARLGELVRAFAVAGNAAMPERESRLQKLTAVRAALDAAITGKGGATAQKIQSTAGLVAAREAFLHVYNKVAKPLVRGQLANLGREQELKDFFPDLAVNEGRRGGAAGDVEEAAGEAQPG